MKTFSTAKNKAAKERKQLILAMCLLVPLAVLVVVSVMWGMLSMAARVVVS